MPKAKSGEIYKRELRITPPDQVPITDWKVNADDFVKLLACEEGGVDTEKKLHYHLYIESTRSESWIKKWIYSIAHCYNGESGNAVYFSRQPHEHTIGYVIKSGNVVCRHGIEETFIIEWIAKSDEYKRNKEASRKRQQRSRAGILQSMMDGVASDLKTERIDRTAEAVSEALQDRYITEQVYALRTQHEMMVIKLIHPYDTSFVRSYYNNFLHRW